MQPLTALRNIPSLVRIAGITALIVALAACGSTAGVSTTASPGTAGTPVVTADGGQGAAAPANDVSGDCNSATQATYVADTTDGATVKGGMRGKLHPTMTEITNTLAAQQPPIGGSSAIGQLLPAGGTTGVICANGDIYKGGRKVATDAVFIDRTPSATITHIGSMEFYHTPATEALKAAGINACPALVWTSGPFLKAICLDNNDVVVTSKPVV